MTNLKTALISHRFRGFSKRENTIDGLNAALDFGVAYVEFDIRVAACGTPMIYHDEAAPDKIGAHRHLAHHKASDYKTLGGTFTYMPTADALFAAIAAHKNSTTTLLIDIKDGGFEEAIHALVCLHRLQSRVHYVTWVPNVLYTMHEIAPEIPLCLSHWCQNPDASIRKKHIVHTAKDGHVPRLDTAIIHGERSGWFIDGPLSGRLRDILITSKGSVCVPQNMVTRELVDNYHADGLMVSTFSYVDWDHINRHKAEHNIDLYFIDDKKVFDEG
ncbi:MAG: glycerophosphodiester phosphodiesterase family protein [Maricaulaceae bacterium]